jgi:hypothetical protein
VAPDSGARRGGSAVPRRRPCGSSTSKG